MSEMMHLWAKPQGIPSQLENNPLPTVSICIVNWNTRDHIDQCLNSIYENAGLIPIEVIVVDNGSADNSVDLIIRKYPQVRLISNKDNRGFGQANNQALHASTGQYCFLLNSDTLLLKGAIDALHHFMEARPEAAVATCKVFQTLSKGEVLISYAPTFPTPKSVFLSDFVGLTGLRQLFPGSRFVQNSLWIGIEPEREQEVAIVTGACMFVRRTAIDRVGGFDETFFMYMEETDWCYRFREAGWKVFYTPDASIVHLCEGSSRLRNDRDKLYYDSICYFFEKHYGKTSALIYRCQEVLLLRWLRRLHRLWLRYRPQ